MYIETRAVVKRLFWTLKLKNCNTGNPTSKIEVIIFTHKVDEHPAGWLENYTYPSIFMPIAAAYARTESVIK